MDPNLVGSFLMGKVGTRWCSSYGHFNEALNRNELTN